MTQNQPLVTIIIPSYNCNSTIVEALNSIKNQTYKNLEVIIIDDYSTDNSLEIINNYKHSHTELNIKVFTKNENKGPAHSRNIGIKEASGNYIALLDSDDYFETNKIEEQLAYLEKNLDMFGCGTFMKCFGLQNNIVEAETDLSLIKDTLLIGMPYLHATFMFRRDFIIKNNLFYNEDYRTAEDYEWSLRFIDAGAKINNLPLVLHNYRITGKQESFSLDSEGKQIINIKQQVASHKIQYSIWNRFIGKENDLYEQEFVNIFLRHSSLKNSTELKNFIDWTDKIIIYNNDSKYFTKKFIKRNSNEIIVNYFLSKSKFDINLLLLYFKYSKYVKIPSSSEKIKFIVKCLTNHQY